MPNNHNNFNDISLLIVEDSEKERSVLRSIFDIEKDNNKNYIYDFSNGSNETLNFLLKRTYDCIILEYDLPDCDGLSLLRYIRELPQGEYVPIIILTAAGSEELAVEAMKGGADDYIIKKNVTSKLIKNAIKDAIMKRSLKFTISEKNKQLRLLEQVVDSAGESIIITDASGIIKYVNKAASELTGYSLQEVVGKRPSVWKSGKQRDQFYKNLWDTVNRGEQWNGEITNRKKNGENYVAKMTITSIRGFSGEIEAFVSIHNDITEQVKLQEELERAKQEAEMGSEYKTEFLANMSHEMRTPLHAIVGMLDGLKETKVNKKQEKYLGVIDNSSSLLLSLINDILDLGRVEKGILEVNNKPINIKELVTTITSVMDDRAKQNKLKLRVNFDKDLPDQFVCDGKRVKQVLVNLLGNAIKFTSIGNIDLSIKKEDKYILFTVQDTGIGIAKDKLGKIWERFGQEDTSIKGTFGGTGLGLAINKQLVNLMGGDIWVESEKGKGSKFQFRLPIRNDINAFRITEESSFDANLFANNPEILSILVADDSVEAREVMRAYFSETRHELTFCINGKEAFDVFKDKQFDLVLMDVHMPIMDGIQAVSIMRAWEKETNMKSTPIVALSAGAYKSDIDRTSACGYTRHLIKPIKKNDLFSVLAEIMFSEQMEVEFAEDNVYPMKKPDETNETKAIIVDKALEDLVPAFLKNRFRDLEKMSESLSKDEFEVIKFCAHKIAGNAATYGFPTIGDICSDIELAAIEEDKERILKGLNTMKEKLDEMKDLPVIGKVA